LGLSGVIFCFRKEVEVNEIENSVEVDINVNQEFNQDIKENQALLESEKNNSNLRRALKSKRFVVT